MVAQARQSLELARQEARLALARGRSRGFGRSGREAVVSVWESFAAHDPASEEAAAALMSAYAARGQRHLVARAYRRCCDGLEELGLKPSAALEQAYETTGVSQPSMRWAIESIIVTATSAKSNVRFGDATNPSSQCGAVLSNVSLYTASVVNGFYGRQPHRSLRFG